MSSPKLTELLHLCPSPPLFSFPFPLSLTPTLNPARGLGSVVSSPANLGRQTLLVHFHAKISAPFVTSSENNECIQKRQNDFGK